MWNSRERSQNWRKIVFYNLQVKLGMILFHLRVFWGSVTAACVAIVYKLVALGFERTMGHPLIVTLETKETDVADLEFPGFSVAPYGGMKSNLIA